MVLSLARHEVGEIKTQSGKQLEDSKQQTVDSKQPRPEGSGSV